MKKETKITTGLTIAIILLVISFFWLAKIFFIVTPTPCMDPANTEQCYQMVPHQWGFLVLTLIYYLLMSEWLFLVIRLNKWYEKYTTVSDSKKRALGFSILFTGILTLMSGIIISTPLIEILKVFGIIIVSIIGFGILIGICYYICKAGEWVFNRLVEFNEWLLKLFK